jgi:mono/diheme cytochrome c family protein
MNDQKCAAGLTALLLGIAVVALASGQAWSQQQPAPAPSAEPAQPFAPQWAMMAGWDVFAKKGCGRCHAVRGAGGRVGPDLARIQPEAGFFDVGAALWNHLPRMGAKMREAGIQRPELTPAELSNLTAFLFTARYSDETGKPEEGKRLFAAKGCRQCHSVGGEGGQVGPALDPLKRSSSPVLVAAAMWNHGPRMAEAMRAKGIQRPTFKRRELSDIVAYVVAAATEGPADTAQVVPGTPERGDKLLTERGCRVCHKVSGRGGEVGPALGLGKHHVSLAEFASLMWNHSPVMWAKMQERGVGMPRLSGQDMADIVAYLYTTHYFDPAAGNAARGQQLVKSKGCLRCHSVRGKGGQAAADFATSKAASSPAAVVAGMWNHSRLMEREAEKQGAVLPALTGQELADISRFLVSLPRPGAAKPK